MPKLEIEQYPYNDDNYGVLLHDPATGQTAAVDAGDCDMCCNVLNRKGWNLSQIWITHHDWDHTDGLEELKNKTGAVVFGPMQSAHPILGLDKRVSENETISFAGRKVHVIETPGHTLDMINFYLPDDHLVFVGDTIFVLGCGRLKEGTAEQLYDSINKLKALPLDTVVYCSHEYTKSNAQFASMIDPTNAQLVKRVQELEPLWGTGMPTVPTTIGDELATNPFMRTENTALRKQINMADATDLDVFTELRKRKDYF